MRQSMLLFGHGAGSRAEEGEGSHQDKEAIETAAPPSKKPRRAAASKSEERSKRQMQMTLAHNGKLHRRSSDEDKRSSKVTENVAADKPEVAAKKKETIIKAEQPLSMSVKGTLADLTQVPSFFAKRQPAAPKEEIKLNPSSSGLTASVKQKWPQQREAPWPDSTSIHVQPDDDASRISSRESFNPLPRRPKVQSDVADENDYHYPWDPCDASSSSGPSSRAGVNQRQRRRDVDASFINEHVDLKSFEEGKVPAALQKVHQEALEGNLPSDNALWVDHWRPNRADQVLGNESRSLYLRDWLKALEVTAEVKAGKVIKKVERRKKKQKRENLDGFIVDDEEEEEDWFDHFRKPEDRRGVMDDIEVNANTEEERDYLMNAIVLQGPTGSGKTAAVYACAAELGFEVFEIYPGSGRRGGKDISQAVGNLGRNHMVSSGGLGGGATWKGPKLIKTVGGTGPRQSLILLEEVDLLYEEDKGFWAAVVDLISTSRRPVVMTCNDPSCIPYGTLPIQDVLAFESPKESDAVTYLQLMAVCQGHDFPKDQAQRLYRSTAGGQQEEGVISQWTVAASGPLNLGTSLTSADKTQGIESSPDLRQAIMQLQYLCQGNPSVDDAACEGAIYKSSLNGGMQIQHHFRVEIAKAEHRSLCDAVLSRPFERASEIQEPDEYEIGVDNVQAYNATLLCKQRVKMEVTTLAMTGREEAYRNALLNDQDLSSIYPRDYDRRRWTESKRVHELMDRLVLSEGFKLPSWVPVVEIAPLIANMVAVDDDEQATYQSRLSTVLQDIQQNFDANGSESLDAAGRSLLQLGIRPSRHTMRIILARRGDGSLALSKQETAPCRWFELENHVLQSIRDSRFAM